MHILHFKACVAVGLHIIIEICCTFAKAHAGWIKTAALHHSTASCYYYSVTPKVVFQEVVVCTILPIALRGKYSFQRYVFVNHIPHIIGSGMPNTPRQLHYAELSYYFINIFFIR